MEIKKFQTAAKSKNADVASYAKDTLPDLEKHLKTAQDAGNGTTGSR
jgi:hypothetical protein